MNRPPGSILLGGATVAVVAAVVAGLFALGSPTEERARRLDTRRVADLQGIMTANSLYWTRHARLPATLEELVSEPGVQISTADPATAEDYAYQLVDSIRYEVCATFDLPSGQIARDPMRDLWAHAAGPQCFSLEAKDISDRER